VTKVLFKETRMKRQICAMLAIGVGATWLGCQKPADVKVSPDVNDAAAVSTSPDSLETIQVTLSVPNMV
jgi:hypothetical protein